MKKDKYRWLDAQWCIKCEIVSVALKGTGIHAQICGQCNRAITKQLNWFKKHGLYAQKRGDVR